MKVESEKDGVKIQETSYGNSITTLFYGEWNAVERLKEAYFKDYIPMGYGTYVVDDQKLGENRLLSIRRMGSCD